MNEEHGKRALALRETVRSVVLKERHRGGMGVINAILDHPQALQLIKALEPEELHALMLDIGRSDCVDLVRFATEEQFQGLVDLESWSGRGFEPDRLAALSGLAATAGEETLDRFIDCLDDESLVLYLRKRAQVIERTREPEEEDEIDAMEVEAFRTPDEVFYILLPQGEDNNFAEVRAMIKAIYERDHLDAAAILRHARFEDTDLLEKEAFRFRTARVSSMGFPELAESEALFAYENPVAFKEKVEAELDQLAPYQSGQDTLLPVLLHLDRPAAPFLGDVMQALPEDDIRERILEALAYLANAVLVAQSGGDLSDNEGRGAAMQRALALLSVGLEYVAEGDRDRGVEVLRHVWPKQLFQVGHSLLLILRQDALNCLQHAGREAGFMLFDPPLSLAVQAAALETPCYFTGLDSEKEPRVRDFASRQEVARARKALLQARAVGEFMAATLGLEMDRLENAVPETRRPLTTHTTLLSTALVNALLGNEELLAAVPRADVPRALDLLLIPGKKPGERTINPRLTKAVERFTGHAQNPFVKALFELAITKLEHFFQRFPSGYAPDEKYIAPVLLMK